MLCEGIFPFESYFALVALEWSFQGVFPHVFLQMTRSSASVVALVTFERLFSRVLSHCVKFQFCNCNAWILAACASVWLFAGVSPLVALQSAWLCWFVFTLIAVVKVFPGVFLDMSFEVGRLGAWKVAMCAPVRFLLSVNEDVLLQIIIFNEWLVALLANVLLDPTVSLLVVEKATPTCKCLWTLVTRYLFGHLQCSHPLPSGALWSLE